MHERKRQSMKHIVVGVTGGIAAFKACQLVSDLSKKYEVQVIMTQNAMNFVHPLTFETLTGRKCLIDTFDRNFNYEVEHISVAKWADVFVVAPATANVIAKFAHGICDDMLTTTFLASKAPKVIAPAMNTNMYENPVTQENMDKLRGLGMHFVDAADCWRAVIPARARWQILILSKKPSKWHFTKSRLQAKKSW